MPPTPTSALLVRAALETGARYSELTRLEVADFNPDSGTIQIRQSKSGQPRHVTLTPEGYKLLHPRDLAGRHTAELIFRRADTSAMESQPSRPDRWRRLAAALV